MSLFDLIHPERKTAIVDVGAQYIPQTGDAPYRQMLRDGFCTVLGFEPQPQALAALERSAGPLERYLPYALGDGTTRAIHICDCSGMSSLLRPNKQHLAAFNDLLELGEVIATAPIQTRRMDDIAEIDAMDLLKIDVQGAELEIFQHGRERMSAVVAVQTEVALVTTYENQPTFADVDAELRARGLIPHCIAETKLWPISPARVNNQSRIALRQVMELDLVYVRDFTDIGNLTVEQWKHLAMIAHHCYGSYDLAVRALWSLHKLGALSMETLENYMALAVAQRAEARALEAAA